MPLLTLKLPKPLRILPKIRLANLFNNCYNDIMATYKVPQDVEADDKLLGPFTFRQFIYLMIVFGLIMLAVGLFQVYPLLAIIPLPVAFFFGILALPIKKDQPMETYLAALLSFYTKPNKRYWMPGQSESVILITAPKKVEAPRARNLSSDEAGHRLSFLAELVDTEGRAIKNASTPMKDEFYAEAYNATDMFDKNDSYNLNNMMVQQQDERRAAVVNQMRSAIEQSDYNHEARAAEQSIAQLPGQKVLQPRSGYTSAGNTFTPSGAPGTVSGFESPAVFQPIIPGTTPVDPNLANPEAVQQQMTAYANPPVTAPRENIQQEADRIRKENESEVYVSLH